jgi:RNA polymerase sigma factor (sigma-70 family)
MAADTRHVTPILSATLLRTQSDARLTALAAAGHERAFEAIVERYRRPLHRYCRRILPEARAEDAVQQSFLKAWSALGAGTRVEDLKAWLYRIARNAALDAAKKAGYDYDELSDSLHLSGGVHEDLERRAVIRETLTGVASLPDNQREALLRTAVEGHSRAAIARDLDLTEGAVRQLVHRARTTLRAAVTALTPLPLASWAAAFQGAPDHSASVQRIAELAAGAGSAGGAGLLLKAGTAVVAAGALAVGPPGAELRQAVHGDDSKARAAELAPGSPAAGGGASETGGAAGSAGGDRLAATGLSAVGPLAVRRRVAGGLVRGDDHGGRRRASDDPFQPATTTEPTDDHHRTSTSGKAPDEPPPPPEDPHSGKPPEDKPPSPSSGPGPRTTPEAPSPEPEPKSGSGHGPRPPGTSGSGKPPEPPDPPEPPK